MVTEQGLRGKGRERAAEWAAEVWAAGRAWAGAAEEAAVWAVEPVREWAEILRQMSVRLRRVLR